MLFLHYTSYYLHFCQKTRTSTYFSLHAYPDTLPYLSCISYIQVLTLQFVPETTRHVWIACCYSSVYCFADHVNQGFHLQGHNAEDLHVNLFTGVSIVENLPRLLAKYLHSWWTEFRSSTYPRRVCIKHRQLAHCAVQKKSARFLTIFRNPISTQIIKILIVSLCSQSHVSYSHWK